MLRSDKSKVEMTGKQRRKEESRGCTGKEGRET